MRREGDGVQAFEMTIGPGNHVQQLKDVEDAVDQLATLAIINPVLLSSACLGSSEELTCLFKQEDAGRPPSMIPSRKFINSIVKGSSSTATNGDTVEEGIDQPVLPAAPPPLLEGVTMAGDTALHAVASHGDDEEFFKCADIIYKRAEHLLFAKNNKGDTPLHCAVRAGKSRMVSHLIGLATNKTDQTKEHKLLREVNGLHETALHEAVRIGDEDMVEKLMTLDPELANYPKDQGVSPLYLAIFLQKYRIAETLHRESKGNLSYSGPNGQNALHIAILRSTAMTKHVLEWNKSLTIERDDDGSTPLHFASSLPSPFFYFFTASQDSGENHRSIQSEPCSIVSSRQQWIFPRTCRCLCRFHMYHRIFPCKVSQQCWTP